MRSIYNERREKALCLLGVHSSLIIVQKCKEHKCVHAEIAGIILYGY